MKLSENLKRIRKENNLSQEQLAEKLGVSRQAVSKWESEQSYPEMDKVLLICKLFNYNIDELMNENVKDVDDSKQSKININKYIEDFFGFITKTVDMLSNMKFKQKFQCVMEQIGIVIFLIILFLIIGLIGDSIVYGIFREITADAYYVLRNIIQALYVLFSVVLGTTILLHIFKIRYLDYYEIIKEDIEKEATQEPLNNNFVENQKQEKYDEKRKIFIEKKKEKIIIRDPKQSQSKFLTGLFRLLLNFIKFMVACVALIFVFTFVGLFCLFVVSFMFVKTGFLFAGALALIIAAIIINFIILQLLYNFIISKKSPKTKMAMAFVISLILAGIGCGMVLIGISRFDYVEYNNNDKEDTYDFQMADNLYIQNWGSPIQYVEKDIKEVSVVVKHSKYLGTSVNQYNNEIEIYCYQDDTQIMQLIRDIIKDINKKEIKDYYSSSPEIYVYASKTNIAKLKENKLSNEKSQTENMVNGLTEQINDLQEKVYDLECEIENKDIIIDDLKEQLLTYEYWYTKALNDSYNLLTFTFS